MKTQIKTNLIIINNNNIKKIIMQETRNQNKIKMMISRL